MLVAFEDLRRVYRETIALALSELRPAHEVRSTPLAELATELERFGPHVVVCSQPARGYPKGRVAWVEIPTDDEALGRPAEVSVRGRRWQTENPTLEELLAVVDEAEGLLREEGGLAEEC